MSIRARILEGFKLLLPLLLLLLFLGWIASYIEYIFRFILDWLIPQEYYFSGLGFLVGIATLCLLSLAMQAWLVRSIYSWLITGLKKVPLADTAYKWIQNLVKSMSSSDPNIRSQSVLVDLPQGLAMGFLTEPEIAERLHLKKKENYVAVYFPMSYQIGGFTLLVPKESISQVDISTEEMFTIIMSAGLIDKDDSKKTQKKKDDNDK